MPSCDQIGVPLHFHSSTTSGSASLISLRILRRVSPRQSPSSAILFEMSSDAGWLSLAPKFFIFSSLPESLFPIRFDCRNFFFGPDLTELYCSRLELQDRSCNCRRESAPAAQCRGVEIYFLRCGMPATTREPNRSDN